MTITNYQNGNTVVTIHPDGTKIREYTGVPHPEHPESIDVKITDHCLAGCPYCHEQSTAKGLHGDLDRLLSILAPLSRGAELAIGGGNPLDHPNLVSFLETVKKMGLIANITINQRHITNPLIDKLILEELVHGIGVSIANAANRVWVIDRSPNVVYHLIAGVNKVDDIDKLIAHSATCRVLVLGYKHFGRGVKYHTDAVDRELARWRMYLPRYIGKCHLSFDNLAIEQLSIRRFFTNEGWEQFYMGDDGKFSMYIDAVKGEYAKTSRSVQRTPFADLSLKDYFKTIQGG